MKKPSVLIVLSLSMFIIVIDTTIMNVSIAALVEDLDTTVQGIQAAISLYALVMAAFMLPAGKLSDIIGKKRTFYIGVVLFGIGTFTASISQNLTMLIIGWSVIEGLGSALMLPTLQNILRGAYEGKERALGYAVLGAVAAAGAALGPLLGGFLTTYASWRWAFRLEVIIVIIVLLLQHLIPKDILTGRRPKLDLVGTLLNATGMTFIVLGVILSSSLGWLVAKKPLVIGGYEFAPFGLSATPFFVGLGLLIVLYFFQFEERRVVAGKDVILDPTIFENNYFRNGVIDRFLNLLIQAAVLYSLPLFMLLFLELSSFETGLALMPFSISIIFFSIGGTRLTARFLPNRLIQLGFIVAAAGLVVLVLMLDKSMTARTLFLGSIIAGAGFGLIVSQIVNLILSTVREDEISEATGVNSTGEQLGNAVGVALIGSIMLNTLNSTLASGVAASNTLSAELKSTVLSAAEKDIPLMSGSEVQSLLAGVDATSQQELLSIYGDSYLTAFSAALLFLALLAMIAYFVARRLPATRLVEEEAVMADQG